MKFRFEIEQVQQVSWLSFEIDLDDNKLIGIVGKNGVGKTTLVRALRNLAHSDTFLKTASQGIFDPKSSITYILGTEFVRFEYDAHLKSLNCKSSIAPSFRSLCAVELPMPHGERFRYFQTVSDADKDIRRQIILEEYVKPDELISFLSDIYTSDKFLQLVETKVDGRTYYCILLPDGRYVREDYLSSGEYFLINLYRSLRGVARLIVVDEIDISLDAAAQVHLLKWLRRFCRKYGRNVLFTTHSLAMMRMLGDNELLYMERQDTEVKLYAASYSYVKTLLFGFSGWDRYILTEDDVLQAFLEAIIQRFCRNVFFRYKIIYVGGGGQVADLLRRNETEGFLTDPEKVIAVIDGDRRNYSYAQRKNIHFLPFDNVESALLSYYKEADFTHRLAKGIHFTDGKGLFKLLQKDRVMSAAQIYSYICDRNEQALMPLVNIMKEFLSRTI
jgi:ABC-type dipeptide/oligopeptide/nickel transport system ATPase subunit